MNQGIQGKQDHTLTNKSIDIAPTPEYTQLITLVKGKSVFIATHWDCDGVTAGALVYHLIKEHAASIESISKGDVFLVAPQDIKGKPDVIITIDIKPSKDLLTMAGEPFVISIDHHPNEEINLYPFSIFDTSAQSCSMLVLQKLAAHSIDPYHLFLGVLGFFGDGGKKEKLDVETWTRAKNLMPELMEERASLFKNETYLNIERYVSMMNVGKRMFWNGELPFEMLKNMTHYRELVENTHPLAVQINRLKEELRRSYQQSIDLHRLDNIDYAMINSQQNIQGVLCARYMNAKPILVLNTLGGKVIGSMRAPGNISFDAGEFLSSFTGNKQLTTYVGGGHKEAGGFTMEDKELPAFLDLLEDAQKKIVL